MSKKYNNDSSKDTKQITVGTSKPANYIQVLETNKPSKELLASVAQYLFQHSIYAEQTEEQL